MGSTTFLTVALGRDARCAFNAAREDALYRYGHGGYTGSIAEKHEFFTVQAPPRVDPVQYARWALHCDFGSEEVDTWGMTQAEAARKEARAEREWKATLRKQKVPERLWEDLEKLQRNIDDKWGPAGCIEVAGSYATKMKKERHAGGTHQKVFLFFGWASEWGRGPCAYEK